uniref:DM13 domain-containing protein n=1 Tax=Heterorhabditis bacteriophora TaxID=37862 RepID=A0A1I7XMF1_HETBA
MTWIGQQSPHAPMKSRAPLVALLLVTFSLCEDVLRSAAIYPWSKYKQMQREMESRRYIDAINSSVQTPQLSTYASSTYETRQSQQQSERQRLQTQLSSDTEKHRITSRPRFHSSVIRPQIRSRMPTEPSDYNKMSSIHKETHQKTLYHRKTNEMNVYHNSQRQSIPLQEKDLRLMKSFPRVSIPNGVPFHAGTWENGEPNYLPEKRPAQLAANTIGVVDPRIPLASLNQANLPSPQYSIPGGQNIVNSIFAQSKAGVPIQTASIQTVQGTQSLNPIETLLANGAPLDQISKIANNLLNIGSGSGQGSLLDAMTSALRGGPKIPLTSSAVHDEFPPQIEARPQASIMEKLLTHADVVYKIAISDRYFYRRKYQMYYSMSFPAATAINQSLKEKEQRDKLQFVKNENEKTFRLTKDRENSLKLLEGLPKDERKLLEQAITSGELDPETLGPALKTLVKEDTKEDSKKEKESRLLEWIRENRPNKPIEVTVSADKLPYYGKYCGSLVEQVNTKKQFRPSGALWAVDDRRFIVSKFFFQPGSLLSENVTFWLGPNSPTDNALADMFPSKNGFYIRPQPIDVAVFALEELQPLKAHIRKGIKANVLMNSTLPLDPIKIKKAVEPLRSRRDAVIHVQKDEEIPNQTEQKKMPTLIVKGGIVVADKSNPLSLNDTNTTSVIKSPQWDSPNVITTAVPFNSPIQGGVHIRQPEDDSIDYNVPLPLEWFAGFQPLLLTLPDDKWMKSIHWVALRDHKREEIVASVLIPNGPAFQVPAIVQLRGLSPNGIYTISSGSIRIMDIKTIEISNFSLRTEGVALWFMVGKDILPNVNGHIVPIYDPSLKLFECDSLRDYYGETVRLRLPGNMDMKDVFWFSVFSMTNAVSYSHIYLPYNDMQLPPDLHGIPRYDLYDNFAFSRHLHADMNHNRYHIFLLLQWV